MKLYRFSPIKSKEELMEAVSYIHFTCFQLCKDAFGRYLPVAGNVGVFCHYEAEYEYLTELRKEITEPSDNPNKKYFKLHKPIVIPARGDVPETVYEYLYIRKPDPYRAQTGDVDFILEDPDYTELKSSLLTGKKMMSVRVFERPDLDMIELYNPDIDSLGYVSPTDMTEKVRTKQVLN